MVLLEVVGGEGASVNGGETWRLDGLLRTRVTINVGHVRSHDLEHG